VNEITIYLGDTFYKNYLLFSFWMEQICKSINNLVSVMSYSEKYVKKLTALQFCITKFKNHNDNGDSTTVTWNTWSSFCISTQKHSHWEGPRVGHNKRRWVAVGYLASIFPPQVEVQEWRAGRINSSKQLQLYSTPCEDDMFSFLLSRHFSLCHVWPAHILEQHLVTS
jgi:hypothetical protein